MSNIRVRFAPSPTGQVHIGNIRAAIFNWLFARHSNGQFLLRIEDTDLERSTPEAIKTLLDVMEWLKLDFDEKPPLYQTSQVQKHLQAAEKLIAQGDAYRDNKGGIDYNPDTDANAEWIEADILKKDKTWIRKHINGRRMAMVFQDPMTSLDPTMTIGKQIMEGMIWHYKIDKKDAWNRAVKLLEEVGIEDAEKRMKQYPHQLSGGMRQRIVIAIALSCNPDLLICDEPTTALDVNIQAKILELIKKIQKERNIAVIYITHDLGVVAKVADYVNVMYAGKIVEVGNINEIFYDPRHPYTWGLLSAMPDLDTDEPRLYTIPGSPPNLLHEKEGDAFAPRNAYALEIDDKKEPPMFKITETHSAATWLLDPRAPKVEMPKELKARIDRMKKEAENNGSEL